MTTPARAIDAALEATVVGSFTRIGPSVRRLVDAWEPLSTFDLTGRTVLVTGANSGLGYAMAEQLAQLGATLHITVRSDEKGKTTLSRLRDATGNSDCHYHLLDLLDIDAVRAFGDEFAAEIGVLDGVVHNAGAMFSQRRETEGIENTVLLHVVSPMVLSERLMPALRASSHPGRIVFVSSGGMYTEGLSVERLQSSDDYEPAKAYARAKRAQVVLTEQLAARLGDEVIVHSMHPGWAATPGVESSLPMFNTVLGPLLRDPASGGETAVWLIASDEGASNSGSFWLDRRRRSTERIPGTQASPGQVMALWAEIVELGDLDPAAFQPQADA